ncbi:MAG: hypothetical protein II453_16650 [Alphaproteobacteria bacterium]|nr:hypothetical protein [Alphaproteobacteria bacterium]
MKKNDDYCRLLDHANPSRFYAILRGHEPCINYLISVNKAQNQASHNEAK